MDNIERTKPKLLDAVKDLEVEGVAKTDNKPEIVAALEDQIDPQVLADYFAEQERKDAAPVPARVEQVESNETKILVRMTRKNPTYEIRGHRFTKEHPFKLVSRRDADALLDTDGFRVATPKEAEDFYG